MPEKEDLKSGVILGIFLSFLIGVIVIWISKPTFNSIVFILSLALLPGFFISSILYVYKLSLEKISKTEGNKKFDWGIEINLKKLEILHNKYSAMLQTAGIMAIISFLSMAYLAKDFPLWNTGHLIFFPISTILFIFFLHFAFRWWFIMRADYYHLKFLRDKKI